MVLKCTDNGNTKEGQGMHRPKSDNKQGHLETSFPDTHIGGASTQAMQC